MSVKEMIVEQYPHPPVQSTPSPSGSYPLPVTRAPFFHLPVFLYSTKKFWPGFFTFRHFTSYSITCFSIPHQPRSCYIPRYSTS
jgi:hypothetical protein